MGRQRDILVIADTRIHELKINYLCFLNTMAANEDSKTNNALCTPHVTAVIICPKTSYEVMLKCLYGL